MNTKEMNNISDLCFIPTVTEHRYYNIKLPFEINPGKFIDWIESTGEDIDRGDYGYSVCGMCEYACLWISKLAHNAKIDHKILSVCCGNYGYSDHFWIMLDDKYFIDLTLKQFRSDAPMLSITKIDKAVSSTSYNEGFSIQTYKEYINQFGINLI